MSRARDIANLGSNPPLTPDLDSSRIEIATVASVGQGSEETVLSTPADDNYSSPTMFGIYSLSTPYTQDTLLAFDAGKTAIIVVGGSNYTFVSSGLQPWSGEYQIEANGSWSPSVPPTNQGWSLLVPVTTLTLSNSAAVTELSQRTIPFLVGSEEVSPSEIASASGSTLTFDAVKSFSAGDSVGYYSEPTALDGTNAVGDVTLLGFDHSSSRWYTGSSETRKILSTAALSDSAAASTAYVTVNTPSTIAYSNSIEIPRLSPSDDQSIAVFMSIRAVYRVSSPVQRISLIARMQYSIDNTIWFGVQNSNGELFDDRYGGNFAGQANADSARYTHVPFFLQNVPYSQSLFVRTSLSYFASPENVTFANMSATGIRLLEF